jgi:hypothetical protein
MCPLIKKTAALHKKSLSVMKPEEKFLELVGRK